jgi:beta-glucosidase
LYRQRYRASQGGQISFSTLVTWAEPATASPADQQAAQNRLDAEVGWFLDPIFFGDYPGMQMYQAR